MDVTGSESGGTARFALVRDVPRSIDRCELSHLAREPIDIQLANEQHRRYESALESAGCRLVRLTAEPDLPDSVFVEDTALVVDGRAIILRPGAASRRGETDSVAAVLKRYCDLSFIGAPGTVDGGDLLRMGRHVYAGHSRRTNAAGIEQLRAILSSGGFIVDVVEISDCLHLKSAVCAISDETVLLNPRWVDRAAFAGYRQIEIDEREPFAANALRVGEVVLYPRQHPRTRERLDREGIRVLEVDLGELAKAEGGVTCCCILVESP